MFYVSLALQNFKMKKKGSIILGIALVIAGLLTIGYYYTKAKTHSGYGEELIAEATIPLKADLFKFLLSVEKSISTFNHELQSKNLADLNPDKIDTLANNTLFSGNYLKGVVIFADHLKYVFLKDNDTRITTFSSTGDSLLNWRRLDKNLKQVSDWTGTYNFFLNNENRSLLENVPSKDRMVKWIKLKSEIPGRKDLILQVHQLKTKNQKNIYVAYVFQTSDFSGFFLKKLAMKNPIITILATTGDVFTPVATSDTVAIRYITQAEVELKKIFSSWHAAFNNQPHSFLFEINHREYWARVDTIKNQMGIGAFSLTVSKENLTGFYTEISAYILYFGGLLIFLGLILELTAFLKTRLTKLEEGALPEKHSIENIQLLINEGETESVEFKSSLRYDYRQEKENKALEDVIIKSIAAFSNAKGGTLFIGVDDDQKIVGLENDFNTLKKQNVDYFELHLRKLIKNQFGINFSNHRLIIYFPSLENKTICTIQIATAKKPIYIKVKNKQGQMVEKFYVRNGNSSQEITSLKEMEEYIRNRFEKR